MIRILAEFRFVAGGGLSKTRQNTQNSKHMVLHAFGLPQLKGYQPFFCYLVLHSIYMNIYIYIHTYLFRLSEVELYLGTSSDD